MVVVKEGNLEQRVHSISRKQYAAVKRLLRDVFCTRENKEAFDDDDTQILSKAELNCYEFKRFLEMNGFRSSLEQYPLFVEVAKAYKLQILPRNDRWRNYIGSNDAKRVVQDLKKVFRISKEIESTAKVDKEYAASMKIYHKLS